MLELDVSSLKETCRSVIRLAIKQYNPWEINKERDTLPLPDKLKAFLQSRD